MDAKFYVTVSTKDGKTKQFYALETYQLTPEQKCLWQTIMGEQRITETRIAAIREDEIIRNHQEKQ